MSFRPSLKLDMAPAVVCCLPYISLLSKAHEPRDHIHDFSGFDMKGLH
jgi:hypothetical protein